MNENCCLCICFTELYFFCGLLVVSLAILIAVPFVFSRSVKHCLQEYSKCRAYQTLLKIMHQSIPAAPSLPPHGLTPRALAFFLPRMANSRGWGLLSCQIPRGGDEKRGQMPRPPSTLQHFSLIALSNSAVLSVLMCDFLF